MNFLAKHKLWNFHGIHYLPFSLFFFRNYVLLVFIWISSFSSCILVRESFSCSEFYFIPLPPLFASSWCLFLFLCLIFFYFNKCTYIFFCLPFFSFSLLIQSQPHFNKPNSNGSFIIIPFDLRNPLRNSFFFIYYVSRSHSPNN